MAYERLSDLDELILRCRTEEAREYIAEAVAAYRGGAYRATIVMSWIAVVFDLVDKIRDLSIGGEQAATKLLSEFDKFQAQLHSGQNQATKEALAFERCILENVRDHLSMIDAQQMADLEGLRRDRHRCAHPSFNRAGEAFRPSPELARLHLRNAITHVLSQPPVQGKAALSSLKTLILSNYFPTDFAKAKIQLAGSALNRASPTLVRNFVDALIFGYVKPGDEFERKPQILTTLSVVADMHRSISEPRITQNFRKIFNLAKDDDLPVAVEFLAGWPTAWDMLETSQRHQIINFVEIADFKVIAPSFHLLASIKDLSPSLKGRLKDLGTNTLRELIVEEGAREIAVGAIIDRYLAARSFNHARIRRRLLVLPVVDLLTPDHIKTLISGASTNDQVYLEAGFSSLVEKIQETGNIPLPELKTLLSDYGLEDYFSEELDEDNG